MRSTRFRGGPSNTLAVSRDAVSLPSQCFGGHDVAGAANAEMANPKVENARTNLVDNIVIFSIVDRL